MKMDVGGWGMCTYFMELQFFFERGSMSWPGGLNSPPPSQHIFFLKGREKNKQKVNEEHKDYVEGFN